MAPCVKRTMRGSPDRRVGARSAPVCSDGSTHGPAILHAAAQRPAVAAAVFVVTTACYVTTLAPTVTFVDSGELIAAADSLSVAHPPGFPLYVLVAHLATLLPLGTIAERVHLVSAVFAGVAAAAVALLVLEVIRRQSPSDRPRQAIWAAAAAMSGGLLFGFSAALWSYATVAEVYTLNMALILIVALLVLRWAAGARNGLLFVAAALFGLALGVHHVTVALALPAMLWLVFRARGAPFLVGRTMFVAALLAAAAAALVYAYLPLAASRGVGLNWGDPQTLERIWWHVTGKQYQAFFDFSPGQVLGSLADEGQFVLRQFGPPWLPAALAAAVLGGIRLFHKDRTIFWFLAIVVIFNMGYTLVYPIAEDRDAYLLPTFAALALAAALGVHSLVPLRGMTRRMATGVALTAIALLPALSLVANLPLEDRREYYAARDYVDATLATVGANGLLLTYDWQVYSPLLYVQEVEQRRRDVVAIDGNLLRRSWYFDYLKRRYPALMSAAAEPVGLYLEELRSWERDPAPYEQPDLNQRIEQRFQAMLAAFVGDAIASGPVYATQDVTLQGYTAVLLADQYTFVPQGLVLQLFADRDFHDSAASVVLLRGITDGEIKLEPDDVVREKVLPSVLTMLTLRALYLEAYGQTEQSRQAFAQADEFRLRFGL